MNDNRQNLLGQLSDNELKSFGIDNNTVTSQAHIDSIHQELGIHEQEETQVQQPVSPQLMIGQGLGATDSILPQQPNPAEEQAKQERTTFVPENMAKPVAPTGGVTFNKASNDSLPTDSNDTLLNTSKKSPTDLLKNLQIDVNNIEFVEKSPLESLDELEFFMNGKPTYQVIASQSAYIAHMESMRLADINAINNSTMDLYATKQKLYKTIYDKIATTSLGKIGYNDWLKITSIYDLDTLEYGIYCQTFPGDTSFEVTCRHCNKKTDVIVNNDTLISVKDEELYSNLNEIISNVRNPEQALKSSLVNKFTRKVLPTDKILVDIQTPSLWNQLELFASADPKMLAEMEEIIGTMIFIKSLSLVDMKTLRETGKVKYYEVKDKNQIMRIISKLEIDDASALGSAIEERSRKYAVDYKIKDFKCGNCGNNVGEIPVDIEMLLFTQILRK